MKTFVAVIAAATTLGLGACAYNESLGRNQFLIVDDSALMQQSNAAWAETLRSQKVSTNAAQNERVRRVGGRMVQAAGLAGRQWDYAVFEDASPNAFVLPSGQIGVTTGLLKLVQNDDQLATVIGHEVGHVVARHAAERYSTQSTTGLVLGAVQSRAGTIRRPSAPWAAWARNWACCCPSRAAMSWKPTVWASITSPPPVTSLRNPSRFGG